METPQLGKTYGCQLCSEQFLTLLKLQQHMNWHDEMAAKRAAKEKKPSATELLGLTKEPTAQEALANPGGGPAGPYARPKLTEVLANQGVQTTQPVVQAPLPPPLPIPEPVKIPLKLVYRYIGGCPTCGMEVKTIEVELPDKNAVSAYCMRCDKSVGQQLVLPISKQ